MPQLLVPRPYRVWEGAGLAGPGRQPENWAGGGGAVMCLPSWANMDPAQHLFPALHLGPSHLYPRCPLVGPVTNSPAGLPEGPRALCLYFSEMERLIRHHLWGSVPPSRVISGLPCLCPHTAPGSSFNTGGPFLAPGPLHGPCPCLLHLPLDSHTTSPVILLISCTQHSAWHTSDT